MNDRYIRRHVPGGPAQYQPVPRARRALVMVGWMLFTLAVAALVVLFALAGAGRLAAPVDGSTWVTPATYGPRCHEDQPCGVSR